MQPDAPDVSDGTTPRRRWWNYVGRRLSSGCVISFLLHSALLIVLALIAQTSRSGATSPTLFAHFDTAGPVPGGAEILTGASGPAPDHLPENPSASQQSYMVPELADPMVGPLDANDHGRKPQVVESCQLADGLLRIDASVDGALEGRGREARAALARAGGGSPQSEEAVERGLRWLIAHQRSDGSWHFNHHNSYCQGQCRNPGTESSTTAATAIALLPFLGAGYTHTTGEYGDAVKRGLYYLVKRAVVTPRGYDLQEGTMYAQGLCAIALCEAYAMSKDPALRDYAQGAIDFICYAQDKSGGGWRYTPGSPGDTTVTGWQLMALKSGQMARLSVPSPTIFLAERFLDSVQSDYGAHYGYLRPQPRGKPRRTTTAIGLLCRMYTGWRRDHPALKRGVADLAQWRPSADDMYYNYYATQVLHHWQGPKWQRWNPAMRDHLVATQATAGHEAGSWYFGGGRGDVGGRLYNTAMAVMTLEVYYRHMPLYGLGAVEGGL